MPLDRVFDHPDLSPHDRLERTSACVIAIFSRYDKLIVKQMMIVTKLLVESETWGGGRLFPECIKFRTYYCGKETLVSNIEHFVLNESASLVDFKLKGKILLIN
jgi:hypothetical protein